MPLLGGSMESTGLKRDGGEKMCGSSSFQKDSYVDDDVGSAAKRTRSRDGSGDDQREKRRKQVRVCTAEACSGSFIAPHSDPQSSSFLCGFHVPINLHPHNPELYNTFFSDGALCQSNHITVAPPSIECLRKRIFRQPDARADIREFLNAFEVLSVRGEDRFDLSMVGKCGVSGKRVKNARGSGGICHVSVAMAPSLACVQKEVENVWKNGGVWNGEVCFESGKSVTDMGTGFKPPPPVFVGHTVEDFVENGRVVSNKGAYRIIGVPISRNKAEKRKPGVGPNDVSDANVNLGMGLGLDIEMGVGGKAGVELCEEKVTRGGMNGVCHAGKWDSTTLTAMNHGSGTGQCAQQDVVLCFAGVRQISPSASFRLPPVVEYADPGSYMAMQLEKMYNQATDLAGLDSQSKEVEEDVIGGSEQDQSVERVYGSEETRTATTRSLSQFEKTDEISSQKLPKQKRGRGRPRKQHALFVPESVPVDLEGVEDDMTALLIKLDVSLKVARTSRDTRRLALILEFLLHVKIEYGALQGCAIGRTVRKLRSHKDPDIAKMACTLVRCWRWLGVPLWRKGLGKLGNNGSGCECAGPVLVADLIPRLELVVGDLLA